MSSVAPLEQLKTMAAAIIEPDFDFSMIVYANLSYINGSLQSLVIVKLDDSPFLSNLKLIVCDENAVAAFNCRSIALLGRL